MEGGTLSPKKREGLATVNGRDHREPAGGIPYLEFDSIHFKSVRISQWAFFNQPRARHHN